MIQIDIDQEEDYKGGSDKHEGIEEPCDDNHAVVKASHSHGEEVE